MQTVVSNFKTQEGEQEYNKAYLHSLSFWDVEYESVYVETSFGDTHVFITGLEEGKPLILFHGFGFSSTMWYPNIKELSKKHRVYAIDVLGEFNRSRISKSFTQRTHYVDWINQVLDKLLIEKAVFVGHSNGGWHILNYASLDKKRVEALILLAPAASFIPFSLQFPFRLIVASVFRTRKLIVDFLGRWFVAEGNHVEESLFEQFYQGLIHFGWEYKFLRPSVLPEKELAKLDMPILFLVGTKEVIYNYQKALTQSKKIIPHMNQVIIENAGHALNIEKADEVNRQMIQFLNQHI